MPVFLAYPVVYYPTKVVTRLNNDEISLKALTKRRNWTELNWHGLVFDQLTNGRARSVVSSIDALDDASCNALLLAHWSVRQKLNHVSSVELSSVQLRHFVRAFNSSFVMHFCLAQSISERVEKSADIDTLWYKLWTKVWYQNTLRLFPCHTFCWGAACLVWERNIMPLYRRLEASLDRTA